MSHNELKDEEVVEIFSEGFEEPLSDYGEPEEGVDGEVSEKKKTGRKKGSTRENLLKKAIREYVSEQEAKILVDRAKKIAKTDKRMLMFILEHMFGKARQNVGLDGGSADKPISIASVLDQLEKKRK